MTKPNTEKICLIIGMVILAILLITSIVMVSIQIKTSNEAQDKEYIIYAGVEDEVGEKCKDMMFLEKEDNVEIYAVLTEDGLYLVDVKYEDGKIVDVDVEEELL